jgi:hypothetical protein
VMHLKCLLLLSDELAFLPNFVPLVTQVVLSNKDTVTAVTNLNHDGNLKLRVTCPSKQQTRLGTAQQKPSKHCDYQQQHPGP